jgi:hypothetical protein
MITKLTKEQEEKFTIYRDKWIKIGLSTEPANRKETEDGIRVAYKIAGLQPPNKIVWCGSPFSQGLTRAVVFGLLKSEIKIKKEIGKNLKASVWASVGDSVGDSVRASVGDSGYGQHDANWLAFYEYFKETCGLDEQTQKLVGLWKISKNAGWWLPHEKICWISERHNILKRNKEGRLHCENGLALQYPDEWGIYALNGIRVPEWLVITPAEKIDPALALKETNADVQREIIRKIGAERLLKVCNAKTLDDWNDPKTGYNYKLMDMSIGQNIQRKYLYFQHASIPEIFYAKPVPPEVKKAMHGRAWILSMIERDALKNIDQTTEAEIISNLPLTVS